MPYRRTRSIPKLVQIKEYIIMFFYVFSPIKRAIRFLSNRIVRGLWKAPKWIGCIVSRAELGFTQSRLKHLDRFMDTYGEYYE